MIKAQEKIAEKAKKLPAPSDAMHVIAADMRGYLDRGGDRADYRQMAYGWRGVAQEELILWWDQPSGRREPIKGLFEGNNPLSTARLIQDRIHFLGFIRERSYREGEIRDVGYYLANPRLFTTQCEVDRVFASFPLRPSSKCGSNRVGAPA